MNIFLLYISFVAAVLLSIPHAAYCAVLKEDTVWSGRVNISEDILVPEGVTLTVIAGTRVNISSFDTTGNDPEYLSPLNEITVRGTIRVKGARESPVVFRVKGDRSSGMWGGIIIDGGSAFILSTQVQNAETGIAVLGGKINMGESVLRENKYGFVVYDGARGKVRNTEITENSFGIFDLGSGEIKYNRLRVNGNKKKDVYIYGQKKFRPGIKQYRKRTVYHRSSASCRVSYADIGKDYTLPDRELTRIYGSEILTGNTIWRGRIEIEGQVRVPRNAGLVIMPGTIVEFRKEDTNGDGIGENGIVIEGVMIAKGTGEKPILFRSAERTRGMGDWDGIRIINSDGALNLAEHIQVENAYMGLHVQFSNVIINRAVLRNNYRAIDIQESRVEVRGNYVHSNKSGIQTVNAEILFLSNYVFNNINGVNFFRTNLTAEDNWILDNRVGGIVVRDGTSRVKNNIVDCNRSGMLIQESFSGAFDSNLITNNYETGVTIRNSDRIELADNFIQSSGFDGVNIVSTTGTIKGNNIAVNGERGIGMQSFNGIITGNSIVANGLHAIENEGDTDILAPLNWWGDRRADRVIYDKFDDRTRGMVIFSPARQVADPYVWLLMTIGKDMQWHGTIAVRENVNIIDGATLMIAPGTRVLFAEEAGLTVTESTIHAEGTDAERILFAPLTHEPEGLWGGILLEHAGRGVFSYSDFHSASCAIRSHFTALKVISSTFRNNEEGMSFSSGPVEITGSTFTENRTGITAFMANALIRENNIFQNETGIIVSEKGGGLTVINNNIYSNTGYNIRVGDLNVEDVDARANWWGTDDPAGTIFYGQQEPVVGKVIFEPVLEEMLLFGEEEEELGEAPPMEAEE